MKSGRCRISRKLRPAEVTVLFAGRLFFVLSWMWRVRERGELGAFWLYFPAWSAKHFLSGKASSNQGCRNVPVAASSHPNLASRQAQIYCNVGMVTDAMAIQWTIIRPLKMFSKSFMMEMLTAEC